MIEGQPALRSQTKKVKPNQLALSRSGSLSRMPSSQQQNPLSSNNTTTKPKQIPVANSQRNATPHVKHSPSKSEQMRERVNSLHNAAAKATIRAVNKPQTDQDAGVVDGYLENVTISSRI